MRGSQDYTNQNKLSSVLNKQAAEILSANNLVSHLLS